MLETTSDVRRYARRWPRNRVDLPAELEILVDGRRWTTGSAVVRDVSLRGARLAKIKLKKASLPARAFRVSITFRAGPYDGVGALGRPVRFGTGEDFELAVEFDDVWAAADAVA